MKESPKYNRTFHFPWSKGASSDDKIAKSVSNFLNKEIVITEKLDGSCASLESDNCFARSHNGPPTHPSFDSLKALHANIKYKIPKNFQIFGEYCYAQHSIYYNKLPGIFMIFNIRDLLKDVWYSWNDVELWASDLNLPTVPLLFKGKVSSEKELEKLTSGFMNKPSLYGDTREGIVARLSNEFKDEDFSKSVLKMVRPNHVNTDEHWSHQIIKPNKVMK